MAIKHLLASVSAIGFLASGSAMAADLPSRVMTPVAPLAVPTWTGFYIGANVGYGWADAKGSAFVTTTGAFAATVSRSEEGVIGGGQIGYNYEFTNKFVLGAEADIDGSGIQGSQTFLVTAGNNISAVSTGKIDAFGTVRGRIGFDAGAVLPYFTGGLAWRDSKGTRTQYATALSAAAAPAFSTAPVFGETSDTSKIGWTLGGGLEWKFMQNWTARVEYLYMNFGNSTTLNPLSLASPFGYVAPGVSNGRTSNTTSHEQVVRLGINYMFN